jgi:hypothetical protein
MSNRICGKCGSHKVVDAGSYAGSYFFKCETCGQSGMREEFPEMTLFHQITASPEVLAESVVHTYEMAIGGSMFRVYWTSPFVDNLYLDKAEAIAATVARLKEVEK